MYGWKQILRHVLGQKMTTFEKDLDSLIAVERFGTFGTHWLALTNMFNTTDTSHVTNDYTFYPSDSKKKRTNYQTKISVE